MVSKLIQLILVNHNPESRLPVKYLNGLKHLWRPQTLIQTLPIILYSRYFIFPNEDYN